MAYSTVAKNYSGVRTLAMGASPLEAFGDGSDCPRGPRDSMAVEECSTVSEGCVR